MENRRRYQRYEANFEARIYTSDLSISVMVVDISEGGVGIISEKPVETGCKISISLYPLIENPIDGTLLWSSCVEREKKYYHRIGIETEYLALDKINILGFPINSNFSSEVVPQNNKNGQLDDKSIE